MALFENGTTCSFEVYAPAILGNNYKNVKILGVLTATLAAQLRPSIFEEHAQIFPYLPPGSPKKATGYDYIQIETQAGITTILGQAWIDPASIEVSRAGKLEIQINAVGAPDQVKVRNLLLQAGYNDLTVEFKSS